MIPLIFVSHPRALERSPGGLQLCTDEFVRGFDAGGFDVQFAVIEHDRRLASRLRNRVVRDPYPSQWRPESIAAIAAAVEKANARFVCLNLVNLAPLAPALRPILSPDVRIVLVSHGLESVDFLHTVPAEWTAAHERALGRRLLEERAQRAAIDHVLCLTPFEAEIEHWLGARHVTAVPRTVAPVAPLDWKPRGKRVGFVGTLDHPPTRDGLGDFVRALSAIAPEDFELRLVGGPAEQGRGMAAACRQVRYLGALDDSALREEASTWSAFVHPLFCWARGCSTKLGVALAWQIPILTTPAGARGYSWTHGELQWAHDPREFAALAIQLTSRDEAEAARRGVKEIVRTTPTVQQVGALLHDALTLQRSSAALQKA